MIGKLPPTRDFGQMLGLINQHRSRSAVAQGLFQCVTQLASFASPLSRIATDPIADDIGSNTVGQSVLEVSAGLAALREEWESVARLFGAAEAHTAKTGLHRDPTDEAFLAPLVARARDMLGTARFTATELASRSLSYPEAFKMARLWLQDQR